MADAPAPTESRRPPAPPEADEREAAAWASAFGAAKPVEPFTPDERAQLNLLLFETKLSGDEAGFEVLRGLTADPARYRAFMADRPGDE